jgi:hypothetical protein
MLSLRSLAFILCSAIRRARALSCAALHCFPDIIIIGWKMATNNATKIATAAPMCTLIRRVYTSQAPPKAITARGAKDPFRDYPLRGARTEGGRPTKTCRLCASGRSVGEFDAYGLDGTPRGLACAAG